MDSMKGFINDHIQYCKTQVAHRSEIHASKHIQNIPRVINQIQIKKNLRECDDAKALSRDNGKNSPSLGEDGMLKSTPRHQCSISNQLKPTVSMESIEGGYKFVSLEDPWSRQAGISPGYKLVTSEQMMNAGCQNGIEPCTCWFEGVSIEGTFFQTVEDNLRDVNGKPGIGDYK